MQVPVGEPQMIQGESRTRAPCSKPQMQYYKKILETSLKQKSSVTVSAQHCAPIVLLKGRAKAQDLINTAPWMAEVPKSMGSLLTTATIHTDEEITGREIQVK